jgi:hypothetical protein
VKNVFQKFCDAVSKSHTGVPGMTSAEECDFLRQLARSVSGGVIVEIGSYQGKSTIALAEGSEEGGKVDVFAVEPHETFTGIYGGKFGPQDRQAFYVHVAASRLGHIIRLLSLRSDTAATAFNKEIGLLWIDGDHSLDGVTRDFDGWSAHLTQDATVAFDDSTDPNGGPFQLIKKLIGNGVWVESSACGKIRTIRKAL